MIDWSHWHNEPYLVGGLVLLGWLWALAAGPFRARLAGASIPFPRRHAFAFYSALLWFYLAVGSPLDQIGERFLFSAHMLQHQLLVYPAAVLFLLGLPAWMIDPFIDRRGVRGLVRFLAHPLICAIIYSLTLGVWHAPTLYDLALRHKLLHVLEHVMFFGSALFYWWPLLSPSRVRPPLNHAWQMLYIVGVIIAMTPLFAYVTFSHGILYPTYEYAPRLFASFSAADDQLLAGVMMKLGGLVVSFFAFTWAFYSWYQDKK